MPVLTWLTREHDLKLAQNAPYRLLEEAPDVKAYLDGTVGALLASMEHSGIDRSVVCCIATRPEQFESIFEWCRKVRSDKLVLFPSVHPRDPKCLERLELIKAEGFKGIKLHPYYQDFYADEERLFDLYQKLCEEHLLVVMHTGFDIAFPRVRRADPMRLLKIKRAFPDLMLVATHLGAWEQWDEAQDMLIGKPIYIEISFSLDYLTEDAAREMLLGHPDEYLLFGTDSPWTDQARTLSQLRNLRLSEKKLKRMLSDNAAALLG